MRLSLIAVAVLLLVVPAYAQLGGLKQNIQGKLNDEMQQHNDQVNQAENGDQPQQAAPPQTPANPGALLAIKSGWLTHKAKDGSNVRLYFAYPENLRPTNPAPGLIVIQEWWGVNDDIQERTREFAQHGFYAVAVDLYHGQVTADPTRAAALHTGMKNEQALVDMKTGLDLLDEEARNGVVDRSRVGVIGWCMGGQQALLLALADDRVKATAIFYGPLVTDSEKLEALQGPVLGIFGNNDRNPSPDDVRKFKDALQAAGKQDVTIYPFDGVGHAFASKSAAVMGMYNEAKSKEAWEKCWAWLNQKLLQK